MKIKGERVIDIARLLGISGPAVHGWKRGGLPTADKLAKLADHFGVTATYLVSGSSKSFYRTPTGVRQLSIHCSPSEENDKLRSENENLNRQLEEAREVIKNLSAALAAGRAPTVAVPACGANSGGGIKKGRAEA